MGSALPKSAKRDACAAIVMFGAGAAFSHASGQATEAAAMPAATAPATAPTPRVEVDTGTTLITPRTVTVIPPATAPDQTTPDAATITQPYVATIAGDRVYVRSGPGVAYYEVGQLAKGDLVYVVGNSR